MEKDNICISGIWLRSWHEGRMQVLVEMAGQWYVVIDDYAPLYEMEVSHIVEPVGIKQRVNAARRKGVDDA
jgi:hypothetical protein